MKNLEYRRELLSAIRNRNMNALKQLVAKEEHAMDYSKISDETIDSLIAATVDGETDLTKLSLEQLQEVAAAFPAFG